MGNAKPSRKQMLEARDRESDSMFSNLEQVLSSTVHRDTIVTAKLSKIRPDPDNGRLGQGELVNALPKITQKIKEQGAETVPSYADLGITLSPAARSLYETCANLANTYIPNGGYADSPPKVLPVDAQGVHETKTGHRRYIAYCLAEPITGISEIDVILDKSNQADDDLYRTIGRITENTSRVNNTLAEELMEVRLVVNMLTARGESINKAKLARATGLERTRLSRLVDMVKAGAADDQERLLAIHTAQIEDVVALSVVFKAPQEQWDTLIRELAKSGPTAFRSKYMGSKKPAEAPVAPQAPADDQSVSLTHFDAPPATKTITTEPDEPGSEHFPPEQGAKPSARPQVPTDEGRAASTPKAPRITELKLSEASHGVAIGKLFELLEKAQPGITQHAVGNSEAERLASLLAQLSQEM
ncbi:hypothetical protein [Marinimicrobium sp. ABcell2]|uniref:hypothetical protein n=1 Tax=Marinimicrobium sp. ABcell2 TaxID=3069751 RepID=UPI0027B0FA0E|nr:hypothetical protein [Marinimicrobium sp. ABcell2]MDQ2077408.1 hypothetical protein [Marinimicrobium sp. ABcell2]